MFYYIIRICVVIYMKLIIKNNKDIIIDKEVEYTEESNIINIEYDNNILIINKNKHTFEKEEKDSIIFGNLDFNKIYITLKENNVSFDLEVINNTFNVNENGISISYDIPQDEDNKEYMHIQFDIIY